MQRARGGSSQEAWGIEHVLVDFSGEVMDRMVIGDKVQIKAHGVGLKLIDLPDVRVMNLDPGLLDGPESSGRG